MSVEPGRRYWAIAVLASLALHAGAAGAAAMLFESYRRDAPRTDFVFSDALAPVAARAATAAERVAALKQNSQTAERAVPAEAARLRPKETPAVAAVQRPFAPSAAVSKALPSAAAAVQPKPAAETLAQTSANYAAQPSDSSRVAPSEAHWVQPSARDDIASAVDAAEKAAPAGRVPIAPSAATRVAITPSAGEAIAGEIEQSALPLTSHAIAPVAEAIVEIVSPSSETATPRAKAAPSSPAPAIARASAGEKPSQAPRLELKAAAPASIAQPGRMTAERLSPVAAPQRLEAVQPAEPPLETALLAPERPGPVDESATVPPPDPYRDAVEFVRRFDGGDCFAALPARLGGPEFRTFAMEVGRATGFAQAYAEIAGEPAKIRSSELARAQCDALGFIRNSKGYPAFSLSLSLDAPEVPSGSALSGSIFDAGEQRVHLLVVDDEGRVQLADEFVSVASRTERRFSLPVYLTDGPVRTQQLLIAIATDRDLPMLRDAVDQPAGEFFARLAREVAAGQAELDIAAEAFSVR
jgi:hypothetical protein